MRRICLATTIALAGCGDNGSSGADTDGPQTGDTTAATSADTGADSAGPSGGLCLVDCTGDADCGDDLVCRAGVCQSPTCEDVSCEDMNLTIFECLRTDDRPQCVLVCQTDADCLENELVCQGVADDGTQYCVFDIFCSGDADCAEGFECHPAGDDSICLEPCGTDADCDDGEVCFEITSDGAKTCLPAQCITDADCTGNGICQQGFCRCTDDAQCDEGSCYGG